MGSTFSIDPSKYWIDCIILVVVVAVLVGSFTDYQKENKFHELKQVQAEGTKYKLIRNRHPEYHISDDLLVEDLIMINYGDIMGTDVLLIEGNRIKMDKRGLTWDSEVMEKKDMNAKNY